MTTRMKAVSTPIIQQSWEALDQSDDQEATRLMEDMSDQQPFLTVYLMSTGEDEFGEDEQEFLLFMGVFIWEVMRRAYPQVPVVSNEELDEVEHTNIQMLEYLETEPESDYPHFVSNLLAGYPQPALLQFVTEAIYEEEGVREHSKGMLLVYLKIVIECLHQGLEKRSS